jgi:hypothetical protein
MYNISKQKCEKMPEVYKKYLIATEIVEKWEKMISINWQRYNLWEEMVKKLKEFLTKKMYRLTKDSWDWAVINKIKTKPLNELLRWKWGKKYPKIPVQDHHILSNKGWKLSDSLEFIDELKLSLNLNEWRNRWFIYPHCGNHCKNDQWYHIFVQVATKTCIEPKIRWLSWNKKVERFKELFGGIRRFVLKYAKMNRTKDEIEILDGWFTDGWIRKQLSSKEISEDIAKEYICPDLYNGDRQWVWVASY